MQQKRRPAHTSNVEEGGRGQKKTNKSSGFLGIDYLIINFYYEKKNGSAQACSKGKKGFEGGVNL